MARIGPSDCHTIGAQLREKGKEDEERESFFLPPNQTCLCLFILLCLSSEQTKHEEEEVRYLVGSCWRIVLLYCLLGEKNVCYLGWVYDHSPSCSWSPLFFCGQE